MIRSKNKYYFLLFSVILLLQGCNGTRYLKGDERLLLRQKIRHQPKDISKSSLRDLFAQNENAKIFNVVPLAPRWIHYTGKKRYDPEKYKKKIEKTEAKYAAKIAKAKSENRVNNLLFAKQSKIDKYNNRIENGNLFMQWVDPIAVYDSAAASLTVARFPQYLFANGYFTNTVSVQEKNRGRKKVVLEYRINAGDPYIIDTVFYRVSDTVIYKLLTDNQPASYLVENQRYQQDNFSKERERIDLLLKDNGYYDFSRQYVEFESDTSYRPNRRVGVQVIINDPAKRNHHKKFYVDEINFVTDAGTTPTTPATRTRRSFRNINFQYFERDYSLKILSQRVFIAPAEAYSRKKTFDTQRQLANLNNFKFVNVNYDTSGGKFITNIFTSPLDRYQWSNEIGMSVTQGFPGPFYSVNFLKRNVFKGLENFEMNGRIGYEGVASATSNLSVYRSIEAGLNASITFPQFLLPLSDYRRNRLGRVNPRTRVLAGYTYTNRPEYKRSATSANLTYSWDNQRIRRYDFTIVNLSVINSSTDAVFQNFLQQQYNDYGNTLIYSFNSSFVSSMIFSMTWNFNNYGSPGISSAFFRWALESGGTLQNLIDYKAVDRQGWQRFRYLRASADFRKVHVINKNTTFAYRLNAGVAYAYGDTTNALPYEKYFFAGGSNSIRAWRPRRLGQGSFRPDISENITQDGLYNYQFEKPGDILLEASVELRKKLFGFVEGAIFVDAGNVWTFKPLNSGAGEPDNGNSQFKGSEFYKEIAVGTGFGLRFNFSFLILRIDAGIKAYDPARPEGERFVLDKPRFFKPFTAHNEPVIYNIGIGYSF